jgi:hypothetical protein
VDDLRGGADRPGNGDRPERYVRAGSADVDAVRQLIEPRSRGEYAADLKQQAAKGTPDRPFGERLDEPLDRRRSGTDISVEPAEPLETPRDVLKRFDPERAGLPSLSESDARAYIEAHYADHPWLAEVRDCSPDVQRVFAALDQGGGHAHIRHEGWVTEEMNELRVRFLEDPAQLDPHKRAAGIDGTREGDQLHGCRKTATRITGPDAFAAAFARGIEHPGVRAAVETPFDPDRRPEPVSVPVESLLGPDGHEYCTGWRLEPVEGSMNAARHNREAWVTARADGEAADVPQPVAEPVGSFEGAMIVFAFDPNIAHDGYEVVTMYPRPSEDH